ncbi:unnamed protein product [Citrullus colocynthis]|uniref:Uncharacterized protein n=1 Tax=Citrullus colocynthis TaxID=252529 RepID=A0ABP0YB66_9ROSI
MPISEYSLFFGCIVSLAYEPLLPIRLSAVKQYCHFIDSSYLCLHETHPLPFCPSHYQNYEQKKSGCNFSESLPFFLFIYPLIPFSIH